jgi:hypothetical protein
MRAQRPFATGAALTEVELAVLQLDVLEWRRMVEAIGRAQNAAH